MSRFLLVVLGCFLVLGAGAQDTVRRLEHPSFLQFSELRYSEALIGVWRREADTDSVRISYFNTITDSFDDDIFRVQVYLTEEVAHALGLGPYDGRLKENPSAWWAAPCYREYVRLTPDTWREFRYERVPSPADRDSLLRRKLDGYQRRPDAPLPRPRVFQQTIELEDRYLPIRDTIILFDPETYEEEMTVIRYRSVRRAN